MNKKNVLNKGPQAVMKTPPRRPQNLGAPEEWDRWIIVERDLVMDDGEVIPGFAPFRVRDWRRWRRIRETGHRKRIGVLTSEAGWNPSKTSSKGKDKMEPETSIRVPGITLNASQG